MKRNSTLFSNVNRVSFQYLENSTCCNGFTRLSHSLSLVSNFKIQARSARISTTERERECAARQTIKTCTKSEKKTTRDLNGGYVCNVNIDNNNGRHFVLSQRPLDRHFFTADQKNGSCWITKIMFQEYILCFY